MRLVVGRLPESELERRLDLASVAAEFHQLELLAWVLRAANTIEREAFTSVLIGNRSADALLLVMEGGIRPKYRPAGGEVAPGLRSSGFSESTVARPRMTAVGASMTPG